MALTKVRRELVEGRVVWRKTYAEGGHRRRVALLRWVARGLGADPLLAPVPLTPEAACRTEQSMIARLAAAGARVPAVIEAGERHLLLSDLGPTLSLACRHEPFAAARAARVRQGFEAILRVHRAGAWLSQAFARNMTTGEQGIGFIDLEEDPGTIMSPDAAQARDLLFYAYSTARFLTDQRGAHASMLADALDASPAAVRAGVAVVARRLGWLAPPAALLGTRAAAAATALRSLRQAAG